MLICRCQYVKIILSSDNNACNLYVRLYFMNYLSHSDYIKQYYNDKKLNVYNVFTHVLKTTKQCNRLKKYIYILRRARNYRKISSQHSHNRQTTIESTHWNLLGSCFRWAGLRSGGRLLPVPFGGGSRRARATFGSTGRRAAFRSTGRRPRPRLRTTAIPNRRRHRTPEMVVIAGFSYVYYTHQTMISVKMPICTQIDQQNIASQQ